MLIHRRVLAATVAAAALAGLPTSAVALPFGQQPQAAPPREAARPAPPAQRFMRPNGSTVAAREKTTANEDLAAKAKGVHTIIIALDRQMLTLYADGKPVAHSRISTGTADHPTPMGVFSVIQKDRWHRSNIYDSAPMYYMQRITWSGVAMHQGIVPNHPASHGCIRLPEAFARQMWGTTKLGARVIIARGDVAPVAIAHTKLFTLKREPLEAKREIAPSAGVMESGPVALGFAQLGGRSDATATDATGLTEPGLDAISYAMRNARLAPAAASEPVRAANDAKGVKSAAAEGVEARPLETRPLKPGPVSVLVSRKEGKLFVRKGFEPVFDVPVTIEQPEQPFGTHIYTALALGDDNTTMRWNVVSLPVAASAFKKGGKASVPAGPASNAAQSLERVTIPQDAVDRISEMMSPGSSLIISDQGLGPETGRGTDFIVLTR